ncbi:transglutaminase-like cysteine peptidase [Gallaecimonas sp. GXIMD4217]|uniref:transglutaminase-like cysteine peptidase n=1 Tax=Gallaecimonas sp. GXIMD4217 TaxID=3131927 RepID=UPI00311B3F24
MKTVWFWALGLPCLLLAGQGSFDFNAVKPQLIATYGQAAGQRLEAWQALLSEGKARSDLDKLTAVNDFFNQLVFTDDSLLWGKRDYWATPLEFIGVNGGDCEDFSIAKYFSLLELGIPQDKMRLTYVKALRLNQYHMVLAYYPRDDAYPLILDNLDTDIKSADRRSDLDPIYSFNGKRLWLSKEKGRGALVGESDRLKLWSELNRRYRIQNFNRPLISLETSP